MPAPGKGLYEQLVTEELEARLRELAPRLDAELVDIEPAESADRIAFHVGRVLKVAIDALKDTDRVREAVALARRLLELIQQHSPRADVTRHAPSTAGQMLQAVLGRQPDGTPAAMPRPLVPLLDTTLLTNAPGEPRVGGQIATEIPSADRIDLVMAFIRRTGLRPLLEALRKHCGAGRELRVLTTTYTGSTEGAALDALAELGADVRVSYDTSTTRLHAKAWLFHRDSGCSTAYIGSSNLTHSAQVSGLEWNVRVSALRNPDVLDKVAAVFEAYWHGSDFEPFDGQQFQERSRSAQRGPQVILSPLELRAEPFQERLLEQVQLAREQGHERNLLVAATGTGKTVMAALDYARLRDALPRARLLFVAHRKEILDQALATFRQALRRPAFGELWVDGARPTAYEHVFASVQSLTASGLADLAPEHFDVVIVDEFHHAAARSYTRLLEHLRPRQLLGLTATPERGDGLPILSWFDGRIAAELRLWDAIDQHRLVPFLYYGIHDGLDLRDVPWRRGHGYDVQALAERMTASEGWARLVLQELLDHAEDTRRMRVLGFCVSVDHARFMARTFESLGLPARAVWGETPGAERDAALSDLREGRIRVLFSVDLFNEGLDLPDVDTLLLLRPTDSATLFLQQLGRGLRRHRGKAACTVLDFVGHHRREFRFDRRLRALLGGSRRDLERQVRDAFPYLPAGCHMELDAVASEIVLRNLRESLPSRWAAKAEELRSLARATAPDDVRLDHYLEETGLDIGDVYTAQRGWSDLREAAGLAVAEAGPHERPQRRACGRLLHVDDPERMACWRRWLAEASPPDPHGLGERERRLLRMLVGSVAGHGLPRDTSLAEGARRLWEHAQVRAELLELLDVLEPRIDHLQPRLKTHPDVPLRVHARYTRVEILAACGVGDGAKVMQWQSGVLWADQLPADLLAFTLDKTKGRFSPTTRYRDFAISPERIHWESQSVTRADSDTGQRYQQHVERGSSVLLFARRHTDERHFWFLGPARYVSHRSECPMAITWQLEHRLPGDIYVEMAAAVA